MEKRTVSINSCNMKAYLGNEIFAVLQELGINDLPHKSINKEIEQYCGALRNHLLNEEKNLTKKPLYNNTFWDITPKYRYDILAIDIPRIANLIAYSIGFSTLYFRQFPSNRKTYDITLVDAFFWYHIDFGTRLISSGWDRIALLLDLAYSLKIGEKCSISSVLRKLKKVDLQIDNDDNFKILNRFYDTNFKELEGGVGKGARHETTHIISPGTRFLFEYLDMNSIVSDGNPFDHRHLRVSDMLKRHYDFYLEGINSALKLVSRKWPTNDKDGI